MCRFSHFIAILVFVVFFMANRTAVFLFLVAVFAQPIAKLCLSIFVLEYNPKCYFNAFANVPFLCANYRLQNFLCWFLHNGLFYVPTRAY